MTDYLTTDTELTSIADAIRTKGGTSASLTYPNGFVDAIDAIPTGGGVTTRTVTVSSNVTETNIHYTDSDLEWAEYGQFRDASFDAVVNTVFLVDHINTLTVTGATLLLNSSKPWGSQSFYLVTP